jgi:hypothetical protein
MALIKDYELPGTGVVIPNAYHIVTNVSIEKRTVDTPLPPDPTRPNGLTFAERGTGTEVYWAAGYVATISLTVWKDKNARDNDARPIGFVGTNAADNKYGVNIGTQGMDHYCRFMLEVPSALNHIEQAYRHLLTTDYYSGSLEV